MRRVPYPVAIITSTDPNNSGGGSVQESFRGMTVSSFNTVTLTPEPVVSFNVRRPSETLNAMLASRRFLVHLLAPSRPTAVLAREFSMGNHPHHHKHFSEKSGTAAFEFGSYYSPFSSSSLPLPLLRKTTSNSTCPGRSFPFSFECELDPQRIQVHDHTIVLGRVIGTLVDENHTNDNDDTLNNNNASADNLCLTYANTRFWKMGHHV